MYIYIYIHTYIYTCACTCMSLPPRQIFWEEFNKEVDHWAPEHSDFASAGRRKLRRSYEKTAKQTAQTKKSEKFASASDEGR